MVEARSVNVKNTTSMFIDVLQLDVFMYGHTYSKSKDQLGKAANSARGHLNKEKYISSCPRSA